jgi:hypothetical protein
MAAHPAQLSELCRKASAEDDSLDLCGVLWLEHINLAVGMRQPPPCSHCAACAPTVPDSPAGNREQAEAFYLDYLGLTPDPSSSFHVNLGRQQFHLQLDAPPMRVSGAIGIALPDLDSVRSRTGDAAAALQGTQFEVLDDSPDAIRVRCPWGNEFYCMPATPPPKAEQQSAGDGGPPQPKVAAAQADLDRGMGVVGGARSHRSLPAGSRFRTVLVYVSRHARRAELLPTGLPFPPPT